MQLGWLQETIDETFERACEELRRTGIDPSSQQRRMHLVSMYGYLSLRDVEVIRAAPSRAARSWVEGDLHRPPVKVHEAIDHAGWLASESSCWLGDDMRDALLQGIAEWGTWPIWIVDLQSAKPEGLLEILDGQRVPAMKDAIRPILADRLDETAQILGLDESGEELADRLLAAGIVEAYHRRH
jgi:hypothetical protein